MSLTDGGDRCSRGIKIKSLSDKLFDYAGYSSYRDHDDFPSENRGGALLVLELKPDSYELTNIWLRSNHANRRSILSLNNPPPLPFKIEKGKVTYLGSFDIRAIEEKHTALWTEISRVVDVKTYFSGFIPEDIDVLKNTYLHIKGWPIEGLIFEDIAVLKENFPYIKNWPTRPLVKLDDKTAMFNYALACYNSSPEQLHSEAAKYFLILSKTGDSSAQNYTGLCYEEGKGYQKSLKEAVNWFKLAAEKGNKFGIWNLGRAYAKGYGYLEKSDTKAFEHYLKSAKMGYSQAQYIVADCYINGKGINQSDKDGYAWYIKAAESSSIRAYSGLGWCYEHGRGIKQSDSKSFNWYKKGADGGDAFSQAKLGYYYLKGIGVKKSQQKANKWLKTSAQQGNTLAKRYLSEM